MDFIWYIILLISVFVALIYMLYIRSSSKNPFEQSIAIPKNPHVLDQKKRDAVLKNNFKIEKLPSQIDAIVIGSGIGGLTTAAILSRTGKKVLVLEQHDQAGGCCHSFIDKGYEFDVGIHYIGEMHHQTITKTLLDEISDGQIEWEKMNDEFDSIVFKEKDSNSFRYYPVASDVETQKKLLKKSFPEEELAIERFYDLVAQASKDNNSSIIVKFLPLWLVKILTYTGILNLFIGFFRMNERSAKEVVNDLTQNQTLRDIFCYCFGDYGTVPSKAGFGIQALLIDHFSKGAAYPVGGASEIAHSIIPVIERNGGKVLVNADVQEILLDEKNKAKGVKVRHGKLEYEIASPIVVSNAGLYNTFLRLLPPPVAKNSMMYPLVSKKRGVAGISVFVGFDTSPEELDIPQKKNFWVFSRNDVDEACIKYLETPKDKVEDAEIPLLFVSFPSTKDPIWDKKYPGKTTMALVSLSNYEWFKQWENEPCQRRSEDYERLKKTIGWKMIDRVIEMFPQIKDHIDYVSVGTPLSNNFYLGSMRGEIYGLDHDMNRFSPTIYSLLRPKTDIPGVYLTGQDVCSCGFVGGLWGGMICAQQILGRNIMIDLVNLHKTIKGNKKMQSIKRSDKKME